MSRNPDDTPRPPSPEREGEPSLTDIHNSLMRVLDTLDDYGTRLHVIETRESPDREAEEGNSQKRRRDEEGGDDRRDRSVVRGQYGRCDSIDIRFHFLDSKIRDAALACTMAPEDLPKLLPKNSPLHKHIDDEEIRLVSTPTGAVLRTATTKSVKDNLDRFVSAITSPGIFMVAWMHFAELVAHGLGSPDDSTTAFTALIWYGRYIVERAATHTWESVCRYHLMFHGDRCGGSFHADDWYKAVDQDKTGELVNKQLQRALSTVSASSSRKSSLASRITDKPAGPRAAQRCRHWSLYTCPEPCRNGRRHVCWNCGTNAKLGHSGCPGPDGTQHQQV